MSNNPTEPENADVNVPIDRRIDQRLETVDMLDEATVRRLIDEHGEVEVDYDRLADEVADRLGPGDLSETRSALWTAFSPRFDNKTLETGEPRGTYHLQEAHPEWGIVFRVDDLVHLRGATVDAREAGELVTHVLRLTDDSEDADGVDPRPLYERRNALRQGQQYIRLECSLSPGVYFIRRESGPAMRRTKPFEGWDEANETSLPVELIRGWNPAYRPRYEGRYPSYDEGGWSRNLYYYHQMEFGYGVPE